MNNYDTIDFRKIVHFSNVFSFFVLLSVKPFVIFPKCNRYGFNLESLALN